MSQTWDPKILADIRVAARIKQHEHRHEQIDKGVERVRLVLERLAADPPPSVRVVESRAGMLGEQILRDEILNGSRYASRCPECGHRFTITVTAEPKEPSA